MAFSAELRGIAKSYGEVHANRGVDLLIREGTIHALVGENGAGKSTAMKILFGMIRPDSGSIVYGGEEVQGAHWSPEAAFRRGIGMVHQHFMLAETETVHDNLVLGTETTRFGFRRRSDERRKLERLMSATGLAVPLDVPVAQLPVGLQSRCEILKVLYRDARFLILDEPTAVLTPQEIEDFLLTLKRLRASQHTILIVTHKLKEVMAVADDATVLRAGKTVATRKVYDTNIPELSELMVGRRLQLPRVTKDATAASRAPLVKLRAPRFELELRPGQITGIAGVEGNGQEALVEALTNPGSHDGLALEILNRDAAGFGPDGIRGLPVAIIPADRHKDGLVLSFTLTENLRLGRVQAGARGRFRTTTRHEKELLAEFDVRPARPRIEARALSGGNQQKLVIARELGDLPNECVVIAVHPTRGVDVGAIEFIHARLLDAAARGAAVLLVSSELDELMALSHRIGVFYRGEIAEWFEGPPYDETAIGHAMLTGHAGRKPEPRTELGGQA
jgi:simple sugar transport system ATP-binding protein